MKLEINGHITEQTAGCSSYFCLKELFKPGVRAAVSVLLAELLPAFM